MNFKNILPQDNKYCKLKYGENIYNLIDIKGNIAIIQKDNLTIKTDIQNIQLLNKNEIIEYIAQMQNENKHKLDYTLEINSDMKSNEIMLRHLTVSEAIEDLDRFIMQAILHNEKIIHIIHGKSGGKIRKAVQEYLKDSPYIESFEFADIYSGSYGVTIAKLK